MKRTVSLGEVITAGIASHALDLHTALIGCVTKVYPATRKIDVQPVNRRVLPTEQNTLVTERLPMLPHVPIGALRAGDARVELPINPGDFVLVLCTEDNIGKWLAAGGSDVSPGDVERHGLTGAVAIPLVYPDNDQPAEALNQTDIVLALGSTKVRVASSGVHVTGDMTVTGKVDVTGEVTTSAAGFPTKLSAHKHGSSVGPTVTPLP